MRFVVSSLTLMVVFCCQWDTAVAQFRTVTLSGNVAPGTSDNFGNFSNPVINSLGRVAFIAELDVDPDFPSGIWSEGTGGTLGKVMLSGDSAPGTSLNFESPMVFGLHYNANGHTLFGAFLDDSTSTGIWSDRSGSLAVVAATGGTLPGGGDTYGEVFASISFNDSGETAFLAATVSGGGRGIFSEGSGSLISIAESSNPGFTSLNRPMINNAGHIAFQASDSSTGSGIYSNRGGTLLAVAKQGDSAPGGGTYSQFFGPGVYLGSTGDIAFRNLLSTGGAPVQGIFVAESDGVIRQVARQGEMAPGTTTTFSALDMLNASVVFDGSGFATFIADELGDGSGGIFQEGSSGLGLLAQTGTIAPGSGGANFINFADFTLSENGQLAVLAQLDDVNLSEGIWRIDPAGALNKIIMRGEQIEVAPGDFRTISQVFLRGQSEFTPQSTSQSSINNLGQVAFYAEFNDGTSGVFVSAAAIPEPGSSAILALATGLILTRRQRR